MKRLLSLNVFPVWVFSGLLAAGMVAASGSAVTYAAAPPAKDVVKETVEKVRTTVSQEKDKMSAQELDAKLKDIIAPVFDFREMSQRCLGANWQSATEQEKKEFVDLFSDLLAKNYLKKIREHAANSEFAITGEQDTGDGKTLVKTVVNYDSDKAAIDYRMRVKNGSWKVYDVVIENIGLVSNYRSEFSGIIKKEKMSGLLQRLRDKK